MRLISIVSCILLLLLATGTAIPAETANDQSVTRTTTRGLYAQDPGLHARTDSRETEKKPEPSTTLYQVMGVVLVIWTGLAVFLFRLDRRVARLETRTQAKN